MLSENDRGGVYRACQEATGLEVVVKTFAGAVRGGAADSALLREARAALGLSHPNIVGVRFADADAVPPYLVSAYIEGTTLRQVIEERGGPLDPGEVLRYGRDVANGLAYAHSQGIVHGDVKAENVLVGTDGIARILDFGLALLAGEPSGSPVAHRRLEGTPAYLAPERCEGGPASRASDVFGLGLLISEMSLGRLSVGAGSLSARSMSGELRSGGLPLALQAAVKACLAREPARRPGAAEVARILGEASCAEPIDIPAPRTAHDRAVDGVLLAMGIALALAGLVVLLWH